jgi:hypothetical protein
VDPIGGKYLQHENITAERKLAGLLPECDSPAKSVCSEKISSRRRYP